jgi:hypothetical protein
VKVDEQLKLYSVRRLEFAPSFGDTFEIRTPDNDEVLAVAVERPGFIVHLLALFAGSQSGRAMDVFLPNKIVVSTGSDPKTGALLLGIQRRVSPFRPKMVVKDGKGATTWTLKSKNKGWGYEFRAIGASGQEVGELSYDFRELASKCRLYGLEVGSVVRPALASDRKDGFDIQLAGPGIVSHSDGISAERNVFLLAAGFTVYMLEKGPAD